MKRYVCVHGHFYQPPRENPWLEAIELQDSAYPYHDWNARIATECYSRNAASRILDDRRRIARIVNNYSKISFDFGPTLLPWLEHEAPETYAAVLDADRLSQTTFGGHGSAMAQPYNHMIMPLASPRDQETQVAWGVRDFQHRFQRAPAGMWLPETAVDLDSLEVLARHGIRFTVLSPYQAASVRPLAGYGAGASGTDGASDGSSGSDGASDGGSGAGAAPDAGWQDISGGRVDPTRAYLQRLPSGHSITLFFYDGPVSQAVAFEDILHRGEDFAERLASGFADERDWPQLMHIATDGESYGHHHRYGDMALAYALDYVEREGLAELTNYAAYLDRHPPQYEVRIQERTAWSCAHGLGRWSADCGCNTGAHPGWDQRWRAPLRAALDWLRDQLVPLYEELGGEVFENPWEARDDFIDVILDRSPENVSRFLEAHRRGGAGGGGGGGDDQRRFELLEMQRHAMLMYTSCGWFFDEISGIETVQVIEYAARALQLAEKVSGRRFETNFQERLAEAPSNVPEQGDGGRIYATLVKPSQLDPLRVGAHYAVSSLFEDYPDEARIYSYVATRQAGEVRTVGEFRFAAGRATIRSIITGESTAIGYAVAHLGNHNVSAGVRADMPEHDWQRMLEDVDQSVRLADLPEIVRRIDGHFPGSTFSIRSLFRDEQRKVLGRLLRDELEGIEARYLDIHQRHVSLGLLLKELGVPIPAALRRADERAINHQLDQVLAGPLDVERIGVLLQTARQLDTELDETSLEFTFRATLESCAERLQRAPEDGARLDAVEAALLVMRDLPFEINLWRVQNIYFGILRERLHDEASRPREPGSPADEWARRLLAIGEQLGIAV